MTKFFADFVSIKLVRQLLFHTTKVRLIGITMIVALGNVFLAFKLGSLITGACRNFKLPWSQIFTNQVES